MDLGKTKGLIFDIQGFSVHDGPGCRTLIFLSGCPLKCGWCSNPEGISLKQNLIYLESKCLCSDRNCIKKCPRKAISFLKNKIKINRKLCKTCKTFECAQSCYHQALRVCGKFYTAKELIKTIKRDSLFWGEAGGVTFGGGDPLSQAEFTKTIAKECKKLGIHTAIETSVCAPQDKVLDLFRFIDWAFIDIKHMDSGKHKDGTGERNEQVLNNIEVLKQHGWKGVLKIRMPVIPGFNDDRKNIKDTAGFLKRMKIDEINILPFHNLGGSKYRQLGMKYKYTDTPAMKNTFNSIKRTFEALNIRCHIGSDTPY
ncbi:MAG: glycyl-radical enzyme activating protein [Armatimonadota bacterium]